VNRTRIAPSDCECVQRIAATCGESPMWSVREQNGAGRVLRYAPDGGVTHEVEVPLPQPTSCIFGGQNLDVLYITTSRQNMTPEQLRRYPLPGSVFAVRPGLSGVQEPLFAG
jgi:sugar lactone lactonase YvrE